MEEGTGPLLHGPAGGGGWVPDPRIGPGCGAASGCGARAAPHDREGGRAGDGMGTAAGTRVSELAGLARAGAARPVLVGGAGGGRKGASGSAILERARSVS